MPTVSPFRPIAVVCAFLRGYAERETGIVDHRDRRTCRRELRTSFKRLLISFRKDCALRGWFAGKEACAVLLFVSARNATNGHL